MLPRCLTRCGLQGYPTPPTGKGASRINSNAYATQAAIKVSEPSPQKENLPPGWAEARPFEEIPGPSGLELVRGFIPGGSFYKKSTDDLIKSMYHTYGQVFRIPGVFGNNDIITSMNPDDYENIFRHEGIWPMRRGIDSQIYHRSVHRADLFQGVEGVLSNSGEKWQRVRSAVNPVLMQPRNVRLYLNNMLEVNDEFLHRIREIRDPETLEMPSNFEDEINRLTFESVAAVALNTRLGLLRSDTDKNNDEAETIFHSVKDFFQLSFELDFRPSLWKIVKTPKFWRLMRVLDTLTDACCKYIDDAILRIEQEQREASARGIDAKASEGPGDGKERSMLEKLLKKDRRIAVVMAMDLMMAGVDTTTSVITGNLLCLAKNPEKQELLRREMRSILPRKNSPLTLENMKNMPYLRACIKEGIRMYPIGAGNMRRLPCPIVISGYQVPADNDILMASNLLMLDEKFISRANEYLPERWLRRAREGNPADQGAEVTNPFMYLPFGFGPRSCVGKRIVDLELEITLGRLVRNFNIEFNHSTKNAFKSHMINIPAIPLRFKFEEINE